MICFSPFEEALPQKPLRALLCLSRAQTSFSPLLMPLFFFWPLILAFHHLFTIVPFNAYISQPQPNSFQSQVKYQSLIEHLTAVLYLRCSFCLTHLFPSIKEYHPESSTGPHHPSSNVTTNSQFLSLESLGVSCL